MRRRGLPGAFALLLVASVLALMFAPRGDVTRDASSFGAGRDGYRLALELLQTLDYDARRFAHGVELLPDDGALWMLEPGSSMLDAGPAGMGAVAAWVARGNTLLLGLAADDSFDVIARQLASIGADEDDDRGLGALRPTGDSAEALAALGLADVELVGVRPPLDVGFDDPIAVGGELPGVDVLRGVRHAPYLAGEGLAAGETLVASADGALVWRGPVGRGQVVLVADARLLDNWALAGADNAYLLVRLAELSAAGGPILFEEFSHGYSAATTLPRLLLQPPTLFVTLQLAAVIAVVLAWRTRRFGPVLPAARGSRRSRIEHVRALADLHRRGRHHGPAAARLRALTLTQLRDRLGYERGVTEPALVEALARRSGLDAGEIEAALRPPERTDARRLLRYARGLERLRRRIEERR